MSRVPRTNFHSSELMRCLNDLALVAPTDAETAFAERLGQWIHFTDAIPLSAIHSSELPQAPGQALQASTAPANLSAEFNRAKAMLVNAIIKTFATPPGHSVGGLPALPLEPPASAATIWLPYRRFYEAQQREIDNRVQPLRAKVRTALALGSPRLKKLAELDAMFDKILRGRELELLARVPLLLKARFERLFKEHQQSWHPDFCKDMNMLLLAEVDLRLQPALGLLEAFKKETSND